MQAQSRTNCRRHAAGRLAAAVRLQEAMAGCISAIRAAVGLQEAIREPMDTMRTMAA
jgi:hypothetical protein